MIVHICRVYRDYRAIALFFAFQTDPAIGMIRNVVTSSGASWRGRTLPGNPSSSASTCAMIGNLVQGGTAPGASRGTASRTRRKQCLGSQIFTNVRHWPLWSMVWFRCFFHLPPFTSNKIMSLLCSPQQFHHLFKLIPQPSLALKN